MRPLILLSLCLTLLAAANDEFEAYGGRRKRRFHGLNSVIRDHAETRHLIEKLRYDIEKETLSEIFVGRDEAPPAPKIESSNENRLRRGSRTLNERDDRFRIMLPDRYSVLAFTTNDNEKELKAEAAWWGRLYVENHPSPLQYFRAHFGSAPPQRVVKLLLASPLNMCDEVTGLIDLKNENQVDNNTVIVAKRGTCTFGDKATAAHEMGAAGILFINNELGNFHVSAPIAHDLPISAAMISLDEGSQLIKSLMRVREANDPGYSLKGRYVAVRCGDQRGPNVNSYCHPLLQDDQKFVDSLDYKGKMSIEGSTFEYLQGDFGSWIDPTVDWTTVVPSVIGGDSYCCDSSGFEGNELSSDHAILCQRGECDFATKAENVGSTGAGLLIVSSYNATMYRMGCEPMSRGRRVMVATAMVALETYEHLVDAHYSRLDDGLPSKLAILQPAFSNDSCEESEVYNETMV